MTEKKNYCDISSRHPLCTVPETVDCRACLHANYSECRDRTFRLSWRAYCLSVTAIRAAIKAERRFEELAKKDREESKQYVTDLEDADEKTKKHSQQFD